MRRSSVPDLQAWKRIYCPADVNRWKGSKARKDATTKTPNVATTDTIIWAKIGLSMFLKACTIHTTAAAIMYRVKTAKIMTADVYFHTDLRTAERWLEDVFFDRSNDLRSGSISHAKDKAGNNSAEIYIPRDSVEDRDLGDTKDRIFKR
jgi:hypothetical protein